MFVGFNFLGNLRSGKNAMQIFTQKPNMKTYQHQLNGYIHI